MGLAEEIAAGRRFVHGSIDHDTFDRPVAFVEIPKDEYLGRFNVTIEIYDNVDFKALQVVTPDADGQFPWDDSSGSGAIQPLLGRFPE